MKKYAKTIIDHKIREKLNISLAGYVVCDALHNNVNIMDNQLMLEIYFMNRLELDNAISELLEKELIYFDSIFYTLSQKWNDCHFGDIKKDYDLFWEPMFFNNRKISWTGTHANGLIVYKQTRKIESAEYLQKQKELYFELISESDFRRVMGIPVFLNPKTKRYSEDWESQLSRSIKAAEQELKAKAKESKLRKPQDLYEDDIFE